MVAHCARFSMGTRSAFWLTLRSDTSPTANLPMNNQNQSQANQPHEVEPLGSLSVSPGSAQSIFEVSENDELNDTYYTCGYFATLAEAVAVVEKHGVSLCDNAMESEDSACVEIHEHRVGVLGWRGQPVWSRRWSHEWSDDDAGTQWVVLPNPKLSLPPHGG